MKTFISCAVLIVLIACIGCGSHSQIPLPPGAVGPFILTVGQNADTLFNFKMDNAGAISPLASSPTGHAPSALVIQSPETFQQNVFVADSGSNNLTVFNLDTTTGKLTQAVPPVPVGTNPIAIASFSGFIYVLNQGSNNISAFQVADKTGGLISLPGSPFAVQSGAQAIAIANASTATSTAQFLYVANGAQGTISAFQIKTSGSLSEVAGSPFAAGTNLSWITTQPGAGFFVYAADAASNNVLAFKVQPDGALTPVSGSPFAVGSQPGSMRISNNFLYVANRGGNSISGFKMDLITGVLTPIAGSPFAVGNDPSSLTMTRGQLYVANRGSNTISAFTSDFNTGVLTPVPGSPFAVPMSPAWIEGLFIMNVD